MSSIKTIFLSGAEVKVDGLAGQNTIVQNLGSSAVYASAAPGIKTGADGVAEIGAGCALAGKVQLTGTDYANLNCISPSMISSGGSSEGGGSGNDYVITKEQIDALFKKS